MAKKKITNEEKNDLDLLVELSNSHLWKSIINLNRQKDSELLSALASIDPFKEPTVMARTQGIRQGIYFLESLVNLEIEKRAKTERKDTKGARDSDLADDFPGYNT